MIELSKEFKLSVEGIRRILKSNYQPEGKAAERQERNRYEAMGERRKEFKTKHPEGFKKTGAWARDQAKEKEKDISSASSTSKRSASTTASTNSNWSNDMYLKRNSNDWKKVSESAQWDDSKERNNRSDERRSFSRERFSSREGHGDRRSFSRSKGDCRSFNRSEDGERRSFRRDGDERRSFNRSEDGERRSFNRSDNFSGDDGNRRPPRSYSRRGGDDKPSFRSRNKDYDGDRPRRSFNNSREDRPRKSFNNSRDNDSRPRKPYTPSSNDDDNHAK